mgnify:CR=1 FL=1
METKRQEKQTSDFTSADFFEGAAGIGAAVSALNAYGATVGNAALEKVGEAEGVMTGMQKYVNGETFRTISEGVSENLAYAVVAGVLAAGCYAVGKVCEKRNL